MLDKKTTLGELYPYICQQLALGNSVRIRPGGDSMRPMLRPHEDVVILSPLPQTLKKYDLPLYRRSNGEFVLHRIVAVGPTYTCIGDNQVWEEPGVKREQMVALVTAFVRNGKEYSVNDLSYRLYCRLWHWTRKLRQNNKGPKYYLRRILVWMKLKH